MSFDPHPSEPLTVLLAEPPTVLLVEPPPRRGHPVIAWLVILTFALAAIGLSFLRPLQKVAASKDQANLLVLELQARYMVGLTSLMGQKDPNLLKQIQVLNTGSISQRLRYVVLAGEVAGPAQAVSHLEG